MDLSERPSGPFIRHPWERARQRLLMAVLRAQGLLGSPQSVLDVGSGDGWIARKLIRQLAQGSSCTCWDSGYAQDRRESGLLLVKDRPATQYSLVLMLDVLEHLEDDRSFFQETVLANLQSGGHALITVPAFTRLFSQHDSRLGHYRRYDRSCFYRLLADAGLTCLRSGGAFLSLLPLRFLAILGERLASSAPAGNHELAWQGSLLSARIVSGLLYGDIAFCSGLSRLGIMLPGLSWWALCQKKS